MNFLKSTIPSKTDLEKVVRSEVEKTFPLFSSEIAPDYYSLTHDRSAMVWRIGLILLSPLIFIGVLVLTSGVDNPNNVQALLIQISALSFLVLPIITILLIVMIVALSNRGYDKLPLKINTYVTGCISTVFGKTVSNTYVKKSLFEIKSKLLITEKLKESQLIELPVMHSIVTGDVYKIEGDKIMAFYELSVNDKNSLIFTGILAEVTFPNEFAGRTIVTTESDTEYQTHKSLWFMDNELEEQVLEWNDFEKSISVTSTNPMEARRIFAPDFMADFYDWWKNEEDNIRISFIGNKMYLLIPSKKQKRDIFTIENNQTQFIDHVSTIVYPIWRTLLLVEDVQA